MSLISQPLLLKCIMHHSWAERETLKLPDGVGVRGFGKAADDDSRAFVLVSGGRAGTDHMYSISMRNTMNGPK